MNSIFAKMSDVRMDQTYVPIDRESLQPGDHIYAWRMKSLYAHHGIYVGDERVIHFVAGRDGLLKSSLPGIRISTISSSSRSKKGRTLCLKCGIQSKKSGLKSSCLDCFLDGGKPYLFEYGVTKERFLEKFRGGCTLVECNPIEEVVRRAYYLLNQDHDFGGYNLFKNNCEDFSIYIKTELLVFENGKPVPRSTQVAALQAWLIASFSKIFTRNETVRGIYDNCRLSFDLSEHNVKKVPAESLFHYYG